MQQLTDRVQAGAQLALAQQCVPLGELLVELGLELVALGAQPIALGLQLLGLGLRLLKEALTFLLGALALSDVLNRADEARGTPLVALSLEGSDAVRLDPAH